MRGNVVILKLASASKKSFLEWDEAIFLTAFQIFENALTEEPNILSRFRYKTERKLSATIYGVKRRELEALVIKAKKLYQWWRLNKKSKGIRDAVVERKKLHQLVDVLPILWD